MTSVYTDLAKKRAEQNQEAVRPPIVREVQKTSPSLPSPKVEKKSNATSIPKSNGKKNLKNLADGKTQISAVVTYEQKAVVLDLVSKFNRRNKVVGSGDIAGIGLDALSRILSRPTPLFTSLEEIKDYVNKIIDKGLEKT